MSEPKENVVSTIQELADKIDGHFDNWYSYYEKHERVELQMIKNQETRIQKLEQDTNNIKLRHSHVTKLITLHIRILYALIFVALVFSSLYLISIF